MNKQPVTMPVLSDTMKTGRIARWLKQPGEPVKAGEPIAEVESDKALMDVEAFADGYLVGPLAPTDTDIPVKSTIAWIADQPPQAASSPSAPSDTPASQAETPPAVEPEPAATQSDTTAAPPPASSSPPVTPPSTPSESDQTTRPAEASETSAVVSAAIATRAHADGGATPFARGLAAELGIDLAQLKPGPDGRIRASQVLAAAIGPQMPHLELGPIHRIERPGAVKAAMAENMQRTVHTPTFHVTIAVDLKPLQEAAHANKQSLTLLLTRACALSVHEHPDFNACWTPGGLARRERIDVAVAVDTPDGLITPVLRNALRSIDELHEDWRELKGKLEKRRLKPEDYSGATFYLSNLGTFPIVEQFDAIVPLGAAAILAVSATGSDGLTRMTLSCDHRVVAGADAARFLTTLKEHLGAVEALTQ